MVTSGKKGPRKSSRKSTKKSAKTAKVQLDPSAVQQLEQHLREGLVASGAVMMTDTPLKLQTLKPGAKVELDSDTVARLGKVLRNGLVASGAVMADELPQVEPSAPSGGGTKAKKSKSKRYASKKR